MTKTQTARELRELRWVETVRPTPYGFVIKTKAQVLSTMIDTHIKKQDSGSAIHIFQGSALEVPIRVYLPQYYLRLREYGFTVQLVKKPVPNVADRFGLTPQYHLGYDIKRWRIQYEPCYGNGSRGEESQYDYSSEKDWRKKAIIASTFLQGAIPHHGYRPHWYTDFAYRLGLVGEEVVEQ